MFYIVEFPADLSCEICPKNWMISGDTCLWPPITTVSNDLKSLIRQRLTPGENWGQFKIRILGEAETYSEALIKCRRAEDESDLSSDPNNYGRGYRGKKRKRMAYTYEESKSMKVGRDEDSNEEEGSHENLVNKIVDNLPLPPSPQNDQSHLSNQSERVGTDFYPERCSTQTESSKSSNQSEKYSQPFNNSQRSRSEPFNSQRSRSEPSTPVVPKNDRLVKNMYREINVIRNNQERILDMLGILIERNSNAQPQQATPIQSKLVQVFPVDTALDMDQLEAAVADSVCENELLIKWKSFGGSTYGDHTRRILRHLCTDSLAETFSWLGNKDKRRFSCLKLSQIIIDAVIQTHNVSRAQVEDSIKTWLRHAKERKDYKKKNVNENN